MNEALRSFFSEVKEDINYIKSDLANLTVVVNEIVQDLKEHKNNTGSTVPSSLPQYNVDCCSEDVTVLGQKIDVLQFKMNLNNMRMNRAFASLDSKVVSMNMSLESDFEFIKKELLRVNETVSVEVKQIHSNISSIDIRMNDGFSLLESKLDTIILSELAILDTRVSGLNDAVRGNLNDVKAELRNISKTTHAMSNKINKYKMNASMETTNGWRQVANFDMTDPNSTCPPGWQLTGYSKRSCGRVNISRMSCDSVFFPVSGGPYNQVWGRIKAYAWGRPMAFYVTGRETIDSVYFSGVAVMHGNPRQHIWTFAAGGLENITYHYLSCPCDTPRINTKPAPPFVGEDYFCESGYIWPGFWNSTEYRSFHFNDTLWDGKDCHSTSTCCALHNPPYFTRHLSKTSTNDLELRLCNIHSKYDSNIAVESIELHVKLDYIQTKLHEIDDKMKVSFAHQTNNINNLHVHQCGGTGGWRRAVYLDMTDPSTDCPPGMTLTGLSKRTCTRSRTIEWTATQPSFLLVEANTIRCVEE